MWQGWTEQAGQTWTVALFSPVVGRLTFWVAFQGPLPSWTATVSVPTSPATGAMRLRVKAQQHAAVGLVLLARNGSCRHHTAMSHVLHRQSHILRPCTTSQGVATFCGTRDSAYRPQKPHAIALGNNERRSARRRRLSF